LKLDSDKYKVSKVITAEEMYNTVAQYFDENDVIVFAAAVADYTPVEVAQTKIKKKEDTFVLELKKTKDIAKEMGLRKKDGQFSVGFALETDNEQHNALEKLKKKNFDMIVLNSMQDKGAGFQHDTNKISILDAKNGIVSFDLKTKEEVAIDIINHIEKIVC
jgi:phosphopantothenoylcysteine decarboxylase/phosphopantothenate--cysteine ligase